MLVCWSFNVHSPFVKFLFFMTTAAIQNTMKVAIDPTEDLFTISPSFKKIIGDQNPPNAIFGNDSDNTSDNNSLIINPINANLGFSMFNGSITRRTGKRMSVYQLLLDSQLELRRYVQINIIISLKTFFSLTTTFQRW